jgi:predicted kinase
MCGLPGSGKSAVARVLAERLGALHWDKDELRSVLFPADRVRYDAQVNDACMELLYSALPEAFKANSVVIIDGRPFTQRAQRERVREAALDAGAALVFVRCDAPLDVLRSRVDAQNHPAPDRTPDLVDQVAARMEPFDGGELELDTGRMGVEDAADACIAALARRSLNPA